jgi:hypothetical protein
VSEGVARSWKVSYDANMHSPCKCTFGCKKTGERKREKFWYRRVAGRWRGLHLSLLIYQRLVLYKISDFNFRWQSCRSRRRRSRCRSRCWPSNGSPSRTSDCRSGVDFKKPFRPKLAVKYRFVVTYKYP